MPLNFSVELKKQLKWQRQDSGKFGLLMLQALPNIYWRRSTVFVIEVHLTKTQYTKIRSQAYTKNWNCPGKPTNLETTISNTSVEVTWDKYLCHRRIKTVLICIWFPLIHLPRVWKNCPKCYNNIFARRIKLLALPKESQNLSCSRVTTTDDSDNTVEEISN